MKPVASCMEDQGFDNGGLQKSIMENGIKLRINMKRSRDRSEEGEDVEAASSRESVTVSDYSKRAGDDDDDVVPGDADDTLPEHECKVCSKCFSSGRALAGHMRVHGRGGGAPSSTPQPAEEAQRTQNNLKDDSHDSSDDDLDDDSSVVVKRKIPATAAVCVLCKKEFPSMKSLFGHMRCHPDRDWRGIQPPEKLLSSPSSTVSNSEPKTETRISSWPVTSRRCKKRTMADSGLQQAERDAVPDTDDPILDAAYDLMMLKNAIAPLAALDPSAANESRLSKKRKKKKKKIGALMDRSEKYRCNTCNKAFASHQALGGHRTSHRKDHLVTNAAGQQSEEDEEDDEVDEEPQQKRAELPPPVESDGKELSAHECKICHKFFPSGQALGGHKRCHWNEDRAAAAMKLEAAESSSKAITVTKEEKRIPATATAGSMLDFDLNEVAPMEDLDLHALYSMVEMVPASAKLIGAENAAFLTNPPTA